MSRMTKSDYFIFALSVIASAVVMMILATVALASGSHHNGTVTNVYNTYDTYNTYDEYITNTTETYTTVQEYKTGITNDIDDGVALNLSAAALNFDWGTNDWQYSGGLGNYESRTSGSIGLGKRIGGLMLNGSYNRAMESGKEGYNIGITGRFK